MSDSRGTGNIITANPDLNTRASEMGLVIPTLRIGSKLQQRLSRTDRMLEVDQDALWAGTQEIEIENPLTIRIKSLSKNASTNEPTLSYDSDTQSLLRINHKPSAELGLGRKINQAFWAGVLVTDALAEGERASYEKRRDKIFAVSQNSKAFVTFALGVHILSGAARLPLEAQVGTDIAQYALLGSLTWSYAKGKPSTTDYIGAKKSERAGILAKRYPVLDYGNVELI